MLHARRRVHAIGEGAEGETVSLFEACVEVLGSVRQGDRKKARAFVRTVQMAAASVPPKEPFPDPPSQETLEAIITCGSDAEFDAMLASQHAYLTRLMEEYSDSELATTVGRLSRVKSRRSPD